MTEDPKDHPKRTRTRLAKAEMWMAVAASYAVQDLGKPSLDPQDESLADQLREKYGLSQADMDRLAEQIGDELEKRAVRAGYGDVWL